ncbi:MULTISPECIES: hypothetical protein [unclassified Streptomyces]|uniref:hypothetical protein n=1 Tax=unclassified Streptomyces TaxID=2593676 RepID=UPI002108D6A3|nr:MULTISPECIES: hypothetical protein [unclassified Streptomyces]
MERTEYDEAQAAKRLHTTVVVLRWARHVGVVPDPGVRGFAWSRSALAVRGGEPDRGNTGYAERARRAADGVLLRG